MLLLFLDIARLLYVNTHVCLFYLLDETGGTQYIATGWKKMQTEATNSNPSLVTPSLVNAAHTTKRKRSFLKNKPKVCA